MPPVRRTSSEDSNSRQPRRRRQQVQQELAAQKKQARPRTRPTQNDDDKPTPLMLRILLWLGLALLCFVLGYLGASLAVDFLSRKLLLKPENRIENAGDLTQFNEAERDRIARNQLSSASDIPQISLNLFHVKDGAITEARKSFIARTYEDNIRDAVNEVIALSGVPNAAKIKLLHVFRNDDTAFLDMPGQFASALDAMGKQKSLLLITGIVRTMEENFPPLSQVRFLIDSKPPASGGTVDLSSVWKLPKKS
ncbi:MAG: GerMN domain-containing protein [Synergistaceae bacterium]|nr:GerMN domain-containing protein [Synergistaceae bacterium]